MLNLQHLFWGGGNYFEIDKRLNGRLGCLQLQNDNGTK